MARKSLGKARKGNHKTGKVHRKRGKTRRRSGKVRRRSRRNRCGVLTGMGPGTGPHSLQRQSFHTSAGQGRRMFERNWRLKQNVENLRKIHTESKLWEF